jgi:hypothetical protein
MPNLSRQREYICLKCQASSDNLALLHGFVLLMSDHRGHVARPDIRDMQLRLVIVDSC